MEKEVVYHNEYDHENRRAGHNISWAAIFAGAVTFVAMMLIFSLISSAIGFGTADLYEQGSFADAGTGLLVWTVISLLLAFFISGLVSGIASGRRPGLHGFLTWALAVFLVIMLVASGVGAAVHGAAKLIGGLGQAAGDIVGATAKDVGEAVSAAAEEASEQFEVTIDKHEVKEEVKEIMVDSEVPELQPNYLKGELNKALKDIKAAGKEAAKNPDEFKQIATDLVEKLQNRAEKITTSIDQDAVAKTVAKKSELSESEAREATKKAIAQYEKASKDAKQQLAQLKEKIDELAAEAEQKLAEAKLAANEAMNTAARVSAYAAGALVLSIFVSMGGALVGRKYVVKRFAKDCKCA